MNKSNRVIRAPVMCDTALPFRLPLRNHPNQRRVAFHVLRTKLAIVGKETQNMPDSWATIDAEKQKKKRLSLIMERHMALLNK